MLYSVSSSICYETDKTMSSVMRGCILHLCEHLLKLYIVPKVVNLNLLFSLSGAFIVSVGNNSLVVIIDAFRCHLETDFWL